MGGPLEGGTISRAGLSVVGGPSENAQLGVCNSTKR